LPVTVLEDPAGDPCWSELLDRHPAASVFHSPAWLTALQQTYGYEPFVVTTSTGTNLGNGLVVCRVKSWASRRLVSLPFSDHCEPLVDRPDDLSELLAFLADQVRDAGWRSVELRPRHVALSAEPDTGDALGPPFRVAETFALHTLDLRPDAAAIFRRFHPSSTQRAIRRAEREGLTYEAGTSERLLASFYRLLRLSRRRHGLPPQPLAWFRNLVACLGERLTIHVASKDGQPVAGILTLSFKRTMVYKYGGSDARYHRLGAMPFLFWRAIQQAKIQGLEELDLGRADLDQPGLIAFKDHLGATRSTANYYRYPEHRPGVAASDWVVRTARRVVVHLPDAALDLAGRVLYRHLG